MASKKKTSPVLSAPVAVLEPETDTLGLAFDPSIPAFDGEPEGTTETAPSDSNPAGTDEGSEETASEPASAPEAEKKVFGRVVGAKDELGFGTGTVTGAIIAAIGSGLFSRKEIVENILDEFAGSSEAKRKATKTTVSVTFSDVRSPFGKYHASRSLIILETKDGKLSFEETRYAAVVKAIAAGILSSIRGKSTSKKNEVLESFGLPTK